MSERQQGEPHGARFGGFEVDLRAGELSRQGRKIRLADKPFQLLVTLLERPGQLVTRDELQARLWAEDTFVDFDNNLNAIVSRLREALNDSAQGPRFVETIPRKGYRFVGPPPVWDEAEAAERSPAPGGRRRANIALLALAALAVVTATLLLLRDDEPPADQPLRTDRSMLAVLPFDNLSADPRQAYLADGLTEELLTRLGGLAPERLGVIARTSVRQYKNTEKTIEEIGEELAVDFVIEGSVRVQDARLRITVQLIRVSDQTHMWAQSYDREARDLLEIQHEIATAVANATLPKLMPPVAGAAATAQPENVEAFEAYLAGLFELAGNDVAPSRRAAQHFERAVALAPRYAQAWAALAKARNLIWFGAESAEEAAQISAQAREAARKALALNPSLPEASVALAFSHLYHDWDAHSAVQALAPTLAKSSSSVDAFQLAAASFSALARHDEALAAATEALVLDPVSSASGAALGWYYLFAGRPSDAEEACRQSLESDPDAPSAHACLYQALLRTGKQPEAVRLLGAWLIRQGVPEARFQDVDPDDPTRAIAELERIRLEHIFAGDEDDPTAPFNAAIAFALLGETNRAFAALDMALERRDLRLLYLAVDPRFDTLRSDSRFSDLQHRVATSR